MSLAGLQPWLKPYAEWLVAYGGSSVRVTSGYRSMQRQRELYQRWLALRQRGYTNEQIAEKYGLFTPAPPGASWHNYGRAFDLSAPPNLLRQLGGVWRSMGGGWWPADPIHFQA